MKPVIDHKNKDVVLEEGEMICGDCNGWGVVHREKGVGEWPYDRPYYRNKWIKKCEKCNETGKVDWVENVVGKLKNRHMVEPGVYIRETDLSEFIPKLNYVESPPQNPEKNMVFYDKHEEVFKVFDGEVWTILTEAPI